MTHPEQFGRHPGDYDPTEPLIIAYGDAIAARNAAWALGVILKDSRVELSEDQVWWLCEVLPAGVEVGPSETGHLKTREEALRWVEELRDRLRGVLPWPGSIG